MGLERLEALPTSRPRRSPRRRPWSGSRPSPRRSPGRTRCSPSPRGTVGMIVRELLQQRIALARLGGDVGEDMNHDGGSLRSDRSRHRISRRAACPRRHPGAGALDPAPRDRLGFRPRMPPSIPLVRAITIERLPDLLDRMKRAARCPDAAGRAARGAVRPARRLPAAARGPRRRRGRPRTRPGSSIFGLLLATTGGLEKIGDYGRHMAEAPTLLEAIRRAARYISWHTLGSSLALTAEGEACVWRYKLSPGRSGTTASTAIPSPWW